MDNDTQILLRPEAAAQLLSLSRARIYELCRDGTLPVVRIGRSVRVPRDRLEAWAAQLATDGTTCAEHPDIGKRRPRVGNAS